MTRIFAALVKNQEVMKQKIFPSDRDKVSWNLMQEKVK